MRNIILGAGIAGLGASYSLNQKGEESLILEKDDTWGGLCGNFSIDGFRFDRFVHFSHTQNQTVKDLFQQGSPHIIKHAPVSYNLYQGLWLKHPAQNNLFPLSKEEKKILINDFKKRPAISPDHVFDNYEQWLRAQYGNAFAERFPMAYTRKYWMSDAKNLETSWVGLRMYQPSVDEVITGANSNQTPNTYYTKEMRYPKTGGFKQFLSAIASQAEIRYNSEVVSIDSSSKTITLNTGQTLHYDRLLSSLPLPVIIRMLRNVPDTVNEAAAKLKCTCGWQISIALSTQNIPNFLWWYIYDEDILPARVYSPSLKSPDNAPEGCSSLQLEVYCDRNAYTRDELLQKSIVPLIKYGIIKEKDILFIDTRFEHFANVIFDHNIHTARSIVRDYLSSIGIQTIGRFGEWQYFWTDQAFLSGLNIK